jgi:plasmid stability protein
MEAEARAILTAAVAHEGAPLQDASVLQDWVASLYGGRPPRGTVDDLLVERRAEAERE